MSIICSCPRSRIADVATDYFCMKQAIVNHWSGVDNWFVENIQNVQSSSSLLTWWWWFHQWKIFYFHRMPMSPHNRLRSITDFKSLGHWTFERLDVGFAWDLWQCFAWISFHHFISCPSPRTPAHMRDPMFQSITYLHPYMRQRHQLMTIIHAINPTVYRVACMDYNENLFSSFRYRVNDFSTAHINVFAHIFIHDRHSAEHFFIVFTIHAVRCMSNQLYRIESSRWNTE